MTDAAIAGDRFGPISEWRARLFGALADRLGVEGERRLLWLPVFFGIGIGLYFVLKAEPPLWPGIAAAITGIGAALALRRHPACYEAALAFTALAAGFALMCETRGSAARRCCSGISVRLRSPAASSASTLPKRAGAS